MRVRAPVEARIQNRQRRVVGVDRKVGNFVVVLPSDRLHVRAAEKKPVGCIRQICSVNVNVGSEMMQFWFLRVASDDADMAAQRRWKNVVFFANTFERRRTNFRKRAPTCRTGRRQCTTRAATSAAHRGRPRGCRAGAAAARTARSRGAPRERR
jgi:hypothetical protein